jgi:hypothetical protein
MDMIEGNLTIAEDRILSLEACIHNNSGNKVTKWALHALFFFEAELKLENFVKQRRRWNNGTAAGYFFLVRDCWSKIWLEGESTHRLPICYFCWPMWQIAVTLMVFCELFKYLVVAVTPSIFIIGLHLSLTQPWVFGAGSKPYHATFSSSGGSPAATDDDYDEQRLDQQVYVSGFTAAYVLLYVYFAISHTKNGDPRKDRDFQGWTFMLAILSNALIMCFSFTGIAISVGQGITSFAKDWKANLGNELPESGVKEVLERVNKNFQADEIPGLGVGLNVEEAYEVLLQQHTHTKATKLSDAGVVIHQFDEINKLGYPWIPCAKGGECEQYSLVVQLEDTSWYDLSKIDKHFEGGFLSTSLISKPLSMMKNSESGYVGIVPLFSSGANAARDVGTTPGGIVLKSKTVDGWMDKAFKCAYPMDGGTMTRLSTGATPRKGAPLEDEASPGCGCKLINDRTNMLTPKTCNNWCTAQKPDKTPLYNDTLSRTDPQHPWLCAWKPSELDQMLKQEPHAPRFKSNEFVLDSDEYVKNIENHIDAFFYPVNDLSCPEKTCQKYVANAHRDFLKKYNTYVPLLKLDRLNLETPFSEGDTHLADKTSDLGELVAKKSYFVVFFPLAFVLFPIFVTIISAITATIEKGTHNIQREWTGVWLMCTRFIPYYLFLPTMIAWFGAYAIARSSDLKWGNRPDSTESSGEVIETARILVGLGVTINLVLSAVSIYMTANSTYVAVMVFVVLFCSVFEMSISLVYFLFNLATVFPRYCGKSKRMQAVPETPPLMSKGGESVQDQYQQLDDGNDPQAPRIKRQFKSEQPLSTLRENDEEI